MRPIDVLHLGRERVICCWQLGEVLVDPGPSSCLPTLLEKLGDDRPRALLLTHIHLDHAGASGSLVRRWPDLQVYVHERGARHMADPARLLASAKRLYKEDMDRLWGEFIAVPQENLHPLTGGEQLTIGNGTFDVAYTPGHASHHVSYLHNGTAFVGDVGGVRIVPGAPAIPPTPPPDIDLEAWHSSIARIKAWGPTALAFTHFGSSDTPQEQLDEVDERLDRWAEAARHQTEQIWTATITANIRASAASDGAFAAYMQAVPTDQAYAGLRRYWQNRAEAAIARAEG